MTQNCGKCDKVFVTKVALKEHMMSHEDKQSSRKRGRPGSKIPCGDCDEIFFRRCDLRLHRRMMHQLKKNGCRVCGRSFSNERRLKMHAQFHNVGGEFECFYCLKEFNKGWKLKIHLVNHSGKPPYICQYCEEDFLYPGKILDHLKREHDVYLACKDCGIAFRSLMEQEGHVCKLYGCKDCRMSFSAMKELASHSETHKMKIEDPSVGGTASQESSVSDSSSFSEPLTTCLSLYSVNFPLCPQSNEVTLTPRVPSNDISIQKIVESATDNSSSKFEVQLFNFGGLKKCVLNIPELKEQIPSKENICGKKEGKVSDASINLILGGNVNVAYTYNTDTDMGVSAVEDKLNCMQSEETKDSGCSFKVPKTNWNSSKHHINILKKKPRNTKKEVKKQNGMVSECKLSTDETPLVIDEQGDLESWLTSENSPCVTDDFVFGMEPDKPGTSLDSPHQCSSGKIIVKKEECEMSFEDLCQF